MNESLAIKFLTGGQISLVTDQRVEGFQAVCQNALVNLLVDAGTDTVFDQRGTDLFISSLQGSVFDLRSASHVCNFAASETLFFSRDTDTAAEADQLNAVHLTPVFVGAQRMDAQVGFESIDRRTMSFFIPS